MGRLAASSAGNLLRQLPRQPPSPTTPPVCRTPELHPCLCPPLETKAETETKTSDWRTPKPGTPPLPSPASLKDNDNCNSNGEDNDKGLPQLARLPCCGALSPKPTSCAFAFVAEVAFRNFALFAALARPIDGNG